MPRYLVVRPATEARWDDPVVPLGHPTVFVCDPVDTGLRDHDGNRIFRTPDEIGFVPRRER